MWSWHVKRLPSGGAKHNQVEEKLAGPTGDVSVRVHASEYLLLNVRCMVCTIRTTSLDAEAWREYASSWTNPPQLDCGPGSPNEC